MKLLLVSVAATGVSAGQLWADVCTQSDTKAMPFCDMKQDIPTRVADYVKRVSLKDKALNMQNGATGIDSLHIPPYQWGSEGLHGPLQPCVCSPDNKTCACPTSFPCPSALATAFNDSLYFQIGQADGREARAINNLRNHVTQNQYGDGIDYWSPTINMQRDPRWGRNQEVPGEDPELTGNYAANFVMGLQGDVGGLDDSKVQITACCKHFVANSLENWKGFSRHDFNAEVPLDDLRNYYLPPFRSYNAVTATQPGEKPLFDNVPSCSNDWLLKETLRESWKFDGYVTSDCGAIQNECTPEPQGHGVYNCTEAAALSVKAGTDVDCGGVYTKQIENAVAAGLLEESDVDAAFSRLTTQQMLLGLFDSDKDKQPYFNLGVTDIDTAAHQQLALEAARQTVVLLKNDGAVLPIKKGKKVAVVGPHFNATELLISNYHGSRCLDPGVAGPGSGKNFDCITSVLDAITTANTGGSVTGAPGCDVNSGDTSRIAAAVAAATAADVVVLAVGIDQSLEREGLDRVNTTLPGVQPELVEAVLKAKKNSDVIMVLFSGGAMSLGQFKDSTPAIIAANYAGEMGAVALADVLFGDYNPTAKLAATMYPPEYVNQINLTEMGVTVPPGRTHMFYTGTAEFTFGSGLSYTTWDMAWDDESDLEWSLTADAGADIATDVTLRLENVGETAGAQTVLLFWKPKGEGHAIQHLKQKLVGYAGTVTQLAPNEKGSLTFRIQPSMLAFSQDGEDPTIATGEYELFATAGGSEVARISRNLRVAA